jgi:hypothetical protein
MIIAAALCPAPPLLARELTGRDPVLPELRQVCREVTERMLRAQPDVIAVIGAASQTRTWDGASKLDLSVFAPSAGVRASTGSASTGSASTGSASTGSASTGSAGTPGLPSSVGLGILLLDQAGYGGRRVLQAIGQDEPTAACVELGERLAQSPERTALLVMADGSARRGRRAPGHLDERSMGFDSEVERAVRAGDLGALAAVDPALARELMATGRAAWQVLSGAMRELQPAVDVLYSDDPFGVAYLVASFSVADT